MRRKPFFILPLLLSMIGLPAGAQDQEPAALQSSTLPAHAVWLDSLNLSKITQDYGEAHAGKTVDSNPLTLQGTVYPHGVGTHANGETLINLYGGATHFTAMVGLDDERKGEGSITFQVIVDGKTKAHTGVLHGGDTPQLISVDLTGAKRMILSVSDGGDGISNDHADWAGAYLTLASDNSRQPQIVGLAQSPARLVIPKLDPKPAIHGARIIGSTPGYPFLFRIPATGQEPLTFATKNLPSGLTLNPKLGIISGTLRKAGTTQVTLIVHGPRGTAQRSLTVVGGPHKLALTPPMGWNSWNVWGTTVDANKVKAAVNQMLKTGLTAHGYGYVNIDDAWEAGRDPQGNILANSKFPDMKALARYVHSKGMRVGLYSSPGPTTCGGYTASYQHEQQDAHTYADWGFDYLKYDWCSYEGVATGTGLERLEKPYAVMRAALNTVPHDILFSFCQYGMGDVWRWGGQTGGNCWRTTGDIQDDWSSLHDIYESQNGHEKYAGPGHWNDPDMLMVGIVGFGNTHPTHLKPNEQLLHVSMWSLLSAPLLIGCDLTRIDPFTLALLTNDEVLDIDQDPLGKPAGRKMQDGDKEVWARPLFDGTTAAGLINTGAAPETVTVRWSDLGLKGKQPIRDLWLHKDVGTYQGTYSVQVPAHGIVLLKIGKPR